MLFLPADAEVSARCVLKRRRPPASRRQARPPRSGAAGFPERARRLSAADADRLLKKKSEEELK